jgi:hypothetical protein
MDAYFKWSAADDALSRLVVGSNLPLLHRNNYKHSWWQTPMSSAPLATQITIGAALVINNQEAPVIGGAAQIATATSSNPGAQDS